jgi:hypothetical protein
VVDTTSFFLPLRWFQTVVSPRRFFVNGDDILRNPDDITGSDVFGKIMAIPEIIGIQENVIPIKKSLFAMPTFYVYLHLDRSQLNLSAVSNLFMPL